MATTKKTINQEPLKNGINEIVDKIYQKSEGISKTETKKVISTLLEVIDETLIAGKEIEFIGHFKMYTTEQKAKDITMYFGKDKGKKKKIKARRTPRVSFSSALKRQMIKG